MKIGICSLGSSLDAQISPVFGRCPYFLVVDSESKKFKAIPNPSFQEGRGAGVGAAQVLVSQGIEAVICGNFGPNAFSVLQMSGIRIYPGVFGLTINEAIDKFNRGELKEGNVPTVPGGGFGLGRGGRGRGFRRRFRRGQ